MFNLSNYNMMDDNNNNKAVILAVYIILESDLYKNLTNLRGYYALVVDSGLILC